MSGVKRMKKTSIMVDEEAGMRICSKCKEKKPLSEYYMQKSRVNLTRSVCKRCMSKYNEKYHLRKKFQGG